MIAAAIATTAAAAIAHVTTIQFLLTPFAFVFFVLPITALAVHVYKTPSYKSVSETRPNRSHKLLTTLSSYMREYILASVASPAIRAEAIFCVRGR